MLANATRELLDWPIVAIRDDGSNIHRNTPFSFSLQLEEFKIPLWLMSMEILYFSFHHVPVRSFLSSPQELSNQSGIRPNLESLISDLVQY